MEACLRALAKRELGDGGKAAAGAKLRRVSTDGTSPPGAGAAAQAARRSGRRGAGASSDARQPPPRGLLEAVNADEEVRTWWYMARVTSERLEMSDHSWVHVQIVLNVALRLLRLLARSDVAPAMVVDHGTEPRRRGGGRGGGCSTTSGCRSTARTTRPTACSSPSASSRDLLADVYEEPQRTVVVSEALHAIIGHRRRGVPYTLEAGVVRVADALDMAQGRSRIPFEAGRIGIHSLSAAAVDEVDISAGTDRPIRLEIKLNNSAGIFQVDDLLATKIRGTRSSRTSRWSPRSRARPRSGC